MGPLFNTETQLYAVDSESYTTLANSAVTSFIERSRLALTPEFDTENLASMALLVEGAGNIDILVAGTGNPGDTSGVSLSRGTKVFDIAEDYKQDIRVHGRFLNYQMSHSTSNRFAMTGFQLDIGKGGTR